MEARILGPLEVVVEGSHIEIAGGKQRELLAILLVHANEIRSPDQLIEELWGGAPPASALKTLQSLVSRLRVTLGTAAGALETHGHGYRLRLEPGELDAEVFRDALEDGRRARARDEPEVASAQLRDALALWRGPALAEFRYAGFAQAEIARLDELRLAATEERIEADLELGRHAELVVDLEALVAEHPLRERLRGQLMLALYRSGRQAEALSTYQECRHALADELGLEPGAPLQELERRILEHDPGLASPTRPVAPRAPSRPLWRRPVALIAAGVLVLVVAVAVGAALTQRGGDDAMNDAGVLAFDPGSADTVAGIPLGTAPSGLSVGQSGAWVIDADDRTVSQIDAETYTVVRTFSTSSTPTDIAVGAGAVWVGTAGSEGDILPNSISRFDPASRRTVATIPLPLARPGSQYDAFAGSSRQRIAVQPGAVWAINPDLTVSRIDPRTNRIVARVGKVRAENIAAGEGDVWVTEGSTLVEIDTSTNTVARRVPLEAGFLADVAVGGGAVWATDPDEGNLWRVDVRGTGAARAVPLERWVAGLAFGENGVWTTNEITDEIHRVEPRTGAATLFAAAPSPRDVQADEGHVWVTSSAPPSRDAALPVAVCGEVQTGSDAAPDVLLVSSFPLQGRNSATSGGINGGIRLVLEQRGFEAGAHTVGFQSCDSSTAQAGSEDFFRCGANMKAFAQNRHVVAVIGSYTSFCSYLQIPIANQAAGGPLAMISPSNTHGALTEDDSLHPTGVRGYFRLAAIEQRLGPAQVEFARQLGHKKLFVLESAAGEYGERYVTDMEALAARIGVEIVGRARYDREGSSFSPLVRRVVRSRPQSIAIVGYLTPGSAQLLRELRAALGPDVSISAPDAFMSPSDIAALGPVVEGMYVTNYGIPNSRVGLKGRQLLDAFAASNGGATGPDYAATYGAQAAEIVLDAVARSDGTRKSVLEEIRRTDVRDGILGDIRWDANGDLIDAPVTVFRVSDGRLDVDRVVITRAPRTDP
jgi:DNA-binding SARP family transcriptional activator/ABC-type branched-subunit amino acid transport system substrate-binding protein